MRGGDPSEPPPAASFDEVWRDSDPDGRDILVRMVMEEMGIPEAFRGIPETQRDAPLTEGKYPVRRRHYFAESDVGGLNVYQQGIAVDAGVGHPGLMRESGFDIPSWPLASVRERIEAVIVHELVEARSQAATTQGRHQEACASGYDTTLPVSERARQILREQRDSMRPHPG